VPMMRPAPVSSADAPPAFEQDLWVLSPGIRRGEYCAAAPVRAGMAAVRASPRPGVSPGADRQRAGFVRPGENAGWRTLLRAAVPFARAASQGRCHGAGGLCARTGRGGVAGPGPVVAESPAGSASVAITTEWLIQKRPHFSGANQGERCVLRM
jgi:hypothetical protein